MEHTNIHEWIKKNYPLVNRNLWPGAYNSIMRAYLLPHTKDAYTFFDFILGKTDEYLLSVPGIGYNKLRFLREAQEKYLEQLKAELKDKLFGDCYKTRFNWIAADWKRVKNHCRTTDNKDFSDKEASEEFKKMLLISEHSPIRLIEIDWSWEDIYSWVATHWSRHKFEKFISTQRDDRKEHDIPRGQMPQDTPVKFDGYANMQNLIDVFRKRLCYQASPETRALAEDFKMALHEIHPELADVLVPNCVYRCGCPEFHCCGYIDRFVRWVVENKEEDHIGGWLELCGDIQRRYDLYNEMFYEMHREEGMECQDSSKSRMSLTP